jgi:hypothetical protein
VRRVDDDVFANWQHYNDCLFYFVKTTDIQVEISADSGFVDGLFWLCARLFGGRLVFLAQDLRSAKVNACELLSEAA